MSDDTSAPDWAHPMYRSSGVRRLDTINWKLPVAMLRKHNRAFFRGAHPGKS